MLQGCNLPICRDVASPQDIYHQDRSFPLAWTDKSHWYCKQSYAASPLVIGVVGVTKINGFSFSRTTERKRCGSEFWAMRSHQVQKNWRDHSNRQGGESSSLGTGSVKDLFKLASNQLDGCCKESGLVHFVPKLKVIRFWEEPGFV